MVTVSFQPMNLFSYALGGNLVYSFMLLAAMASPSSLQFGEGSFKIRFRSEAMKHWFLAVLAILIFAIALNAQTFRGTINGTVTDPSGAVVPNAQVKATEVATNIDHNTVSTSDGQFAFQDIPVGAYKVTVTASGFATTTVEKITVLAGNIYTLPVQLSVAKEVQTVEVSAAALTVDTTTSTQTQTIESQVVQDIPLNGRDFSQ